MTPTPRLAIASVLVMVAATAAVTGAIDTAGGQTGQSGQPPPSAWSIPEPGWGRPAADETSVYFLTAGHDVVAVDLFSSKERWRASTGGPGSKPFGSQVVIAGPSLVAADVAIVAFDRLDGSQRWRFEPTDGGTVGPYLGAVAEGAVLVGSSSGRLYAIEGATGAVRWSVLPLAGEPPATLYQPIGGGGMVFAGFSSFHEPKTGGVVAVDSQTGSVVWRSRFPGAQGWAGGLVIANDAVIASTTAGEILGLSRSSGDVLWTIGRAGSSLLLPTPDYRPMVTVDDLLIAGSLSGHVIAYDLKSGSERWTASGLRRGSTAMAVATDGVAVFVPYMSGRLLALDAVTGRELWSTDTAAGRFLWPPTWHNNRLFLASDTHLVALANSHDGFD